jgi:hypothetical protein
MDTDAHGSESEVTEAMIGSAFEVGRHVGEYIADLVVEENLIVELKCVDRFANQSREWNGSAS